MRERDLPLSTQTLAAVDAAFSRLETALDRTDRTEGGDARGDLSKGTLRAVDDQFSRLQEALEAGEPKPVSYDGEAAIRRAAEDVCAALARIGRRD